MLLLVFFVLLPITAAQYPCITCQTNINPGYDARNNQNQIDPYGSSSLNSVPGYLPDYKGDKYTDPQRIKDTQALNTPFFESIGGAPPAPPLTPAQKGILSERSTFPYSSYQTFRHLQYRNYQKAL